MKITALILENVRCFRERQRLQIRPLTFLVGEDGAGKTTALQCFKEEMNQLMGSVKNEFTVSSGAAATGKSVHCEGC